MASALAALGRFARASRGERRDVLRFGGALLLTRAGIRVMSVSSLARLMGVRIQGQGKPAGVVKPGGASPSPNVEQATRCLRSLLARWPSRSPCLHSALAAGYVYRSYRPTLSIGVRRCAGTVEAHAFLEVCGQVVDVAPSVDGASFVVLRSASP